MKVNIIELQKIDFHDSYLSEVRRGYVVCVVWKDITSLGGWYDDAKAQEFAERVTVFLSRSKTAMTIL